MEWVNQRTCFFICQNSDRVPRLCAKLLPRIRALAKKKSSFPVVSWEEFVKEVKEINKTADEEGVRNVAFYLNESAEVKENLVQHTWMHYNFELAPSSPTHRLKMKSSGFNSVTRYLLFRQFWNPVQNTCSVYSFPDQIPNPICVSCCQWFVTAPFSSPRTYFSNTYVCRLLKAFFCDAHIPSWGRRGDSLVKVIGIQIIYRFWFHVS